MGVSLHVDGAFFSLSRDILRLYDFSFIADEKQLTGRFSDIEEVKESSWNLEFKI